MVPLLAQELEGRSEKSGISTVAPPSPKAWVHSLPPILRISDPPSVPSCSKAPRGLLVLARVTRIFTGLAISPSPSLRQRPSRYAIRAGQYLADKEFRYLRTVIVTAAVHRGFGSGRKALPLTFRHWAGVSPYTSPCGFAETCVFGKQSPGPAPAAPDRSRRKAVHRPGHPLSRSYGVMLPSSLTRVLSYTSGYLPLPTSGGLRYGHVRR